MNKEKNTEIPSRYNPKDTEQKWYDFWLKNRYFHAEAEKGKSPFSIVIPPPNITGHLHMGHALDNTLQDIFIRWKKMQGYNTLWMPGIDHAGIATQNVVEKKLQEKGLSRHQLGRKKFVKEVWKVKEKHGDTILNQLKKLGASCDWDRQRFTMDEGCSKAVRKAFAQLYHEGLIYRDNYIVNWCPRCETAISDIEVEYFEVKGKLYYINYPLLDGNDQITVATTRPETMLGDTAVAINPADKRFKRLKDKKLLLPLVKRELKIIQDKRIDLEFGTGAVKVTPAHDPIDFEIGKDHNLSFITVISTNGTMTEAAGAYKNLDRYECRKKIVQDLGKNGFLTKIEPYTHSIGHCQRCHTMIEPLVSKQWFVDSKKLAGRAIQTVKTEKIKIFPSRWTKIYLNWMENIKPWCISRQIWWGHQIPAWYCQDCQHSNISEHDPNSCEKCGGSKLTQDPDVLDTWFSSSLWPFAIFGWPQTTKELKHFHPTSVLITGYDIIYFWVARMIMMGLKLVGKPPFYSVYIHGLIRDSQGRKMSKSLGNVVDPLEIMEKYGTDALRFVLAQLSTLGGQDITLNDERLLAARNFANKIWNATRFILINLDNNQYPEIKKSEINYSEDDCQIMLKLNQTIIKVTESLEEYKFNEAVQVLYGFIWHDFCDIYIEWQKIENLSDNSSPIKRKQSQYMLLNILEKTLRLLHPFMPFLSEELWQHLPYPKDQKPDSIMVSSWPEIEKIDKKIEKSAGKAKIKYELVATERKIRASLKLLPKAKPKHYIKPINNEEEAVLKKNQSALEKILPSGNITIDQNLEPTEAFHSGISLSGTTIYVETETNIDIEKERKKLHAEIKKIDTMLEKINKKLSNQNFIKKAPQEVVGKAQNQRTEFETRRTKITKTLEGLTEKQTTDDRKQKTEKTKRKS
jgi:valyl-tRNA synthetase